MVIYQTIRYFLIPLAITLPLFFAIYLSIRTTLRARFSAIIGTYAGLITFTIYAISTYSAVDTSHFTGVSTFRFQPLPTAIGALVGFGAPMAVWIFESLRSGFVGFFNLLLVACSSTVLFNYFLGIPSRDFVTFLSLGALLGMVTEILLFPHLLRIVLREEMREEPPRRIIPDSRYYPPVMPKPQKVAPKPTVPDKPSLPASQPNEEEQRRARPGFTPQGLGYERADIQPSSGSIHTLIYADVSELSSEWERLSKAADTLARSLGYEIEQEFPTEYGSVFKRAFWKRVVTSNEALYYEATLQQALGLKAAILNQAEVDSKQAAAAAGLIEAVAAISTACIKVGSVLLLKYAPTPGSEPVLLVRTLSAREVQAIDHYPAILKNPLTALDSLSMAITTDFPTENLIDGSASPE